MAANRPGAGNWSPDRVLIIGAKGRLGSALVAAPWPIGTFVLPATLDQLDITDATAVDRYMAQWRPDLVINAAAFTSIDRAEQVPDLAAKVNHRAVTHLAEVTAAVGARLIHFSTGYVFDGVNTKPYHEDDQVNPLSAYGRSKRAGELAALQAGDNLVIRTSWLYGSNQPGWIDGIRRLAGEGRPCPVADDRRGSPTSVVELAAAVVAAVGTGLHTPGLFHLAAPDSGTWFDMANQVVELDGSADTANLVPVATDSVGLIGRRPMDTSLSSRRFAEAYGVTMTPWRQAMRDLWPQVRGRLNSAPVAAVGPADR